MTTYPLYLVTRNPDVKSLKDFTDKDKIAVPSVKISTQAIMLQMAAATAVRREELRQVRSVDRVAVAPRRDARASPTIPAGVNAHFSTSPFYEQEMKVPGAHLVTTNYEILGGPATALVLDRERKIPRRQSEGLQGVSRRAERSDRHHQQGQAGRRQALSRSGERHQEQRRRHLRDHQRQGLRLHAEAAEGVRDRAIHGQDRHDQAVAGVDGRPVLPRH